jgi:hypothetical protein
MNGNGWPIATWQDRLALVHLPSARYLVGVRLNDYSPPPLLLSEGVKLCGPLSQSNLNFRQGKGVRTLSSVPQRRIPGQPT